MVKGLDIFKKHFQAFSDRYVLIGGVACSLIFEELGINFRGTRDIDIVLHVEARSRDFVAAFWDFIARGKYQNIQNSTGKRLFYRFDKPGSKEFPDMLELFSRKSEILKYHGKGHLTPIPIDEEISSLSAILLDDEYYNFIRNGIRLIEELPVVKPECLIPLKARAWLDLVKRSGAGNEKIDSKKIQKHRDDIFRLFRVITPEKILLTSDIKNDMRQFIEMIAREKDTIKLEKFEIINRTFESILESLRNKYDIL